MPIVALAIHTDEPIWLKEGVSMATIETKAFARGLLKVENAWQAYVLSRKSTQGLAGLELMAAQAECDRDFIRFQNQSQQFYAEVRKRIGDAEKLEVDRALYPQHFPTRPSADS
ncbi:hypothetical protein OGV25_08365 [Pseudomonas sp. P1B16]|uniref:Phasin domain-containing protein n=2 Tax=Pseudomonas TaxID=286 RepID=A0ABY7RDX9_9PSED|nr:MULTISPECIES: hypothetical protein [Pseudomonas]MCH7298882.1 hypothetical protein [Pseudomonas capeferrum]MDD2063108.1 hypothetical protein [Pseudomonas sp. 25571]UDU83060.1 hypothetical protein LJX93_08995 [Pseudomonas sp. HN2-3]WCI02018.1 hypothetical protein PMC74_09105 [Pseudomonas capeferrum]WPM28158.1 hypothetical protein OGV25_08365 [Pseudomonas sp. P1B16]